MEKPFVPHPPSPPALNSREPLPCSPFIPIQRAIYVKNNLLQTQKTHHKVVVVSIANRIRLGVVIFSVTRKFLKHKCAHLRIGYRCVQKILPKICPMCRRPFSAANACRLFVTIPPDYAESTMAEELEDRLISLVDSNLRYPDATSLVKEVNDFLANKPLEKVLLPVSQ